eukprot:1933219-Rhodomonas_salina.1
MCSTHTAYSASSLHSCYAERGTDLAYGSPASKNYAELLPVVTALDIPVIGNGDIFEVEDAQ